MVVSAATSPCIGSMIDRLGTRVIIVICIPTVLTTLFFLSRVSNPIMLLVGITVNRVASADTLPLCAQIALNHWFIRYRGRASMVLGVATAELLFFPGIELRLLELTGERRSTYFCIMAYVTLLSSVAAALWRDLPENCGLLPDLSQYEAMPKGSDDADEKQSGVRDESKEDGLTRREAMQTSIFWAIVLISFNNSILWVGCHFNLLDLLKSKGLGAEAATNFYSTVSFARLIVSISLGMFCLDHLNRRAYLLLAVQAVPQMLVLLLLLGFDTWQSWLAMIFGLIYGAWGGIFTAVGNVLYAQLFGRAHLGAISGFAKGFSLLAGAIGPEFMAIVHQWTGSYRLALKLLLVSTLVSTAMLLLAPLPREPSRASTRPNPASSARTIAASKEEAVPAIVGQCASLANDDDPSALPEAESRQDAVDDDDETRRGHKQPPISRTPV